MTDQTTPSNGELYRMHLALESKLNGHMAECADARKEQKQEIGLMHESVTDLAKQQALTKQLVEGRIEQSRIDKETDEKQRKERQASVDRQTSRDRWIMRTGLACLGGFIAVIEIANILAE